MWDDAKAVLWDSSLFSPSANCFQSHLKVQRSDTHKENDAKGEAVLQTFLSPSVCTNPCLATQAGNTSAAARFQTWPGSELTEGVTKSCHSLCAVLPGHSSNLKFSRLTYSFSLFPSTCLMRPSLCPDWLLGKNILRMVSVTFGWSLDGPSLSR